MGKLLRRLTYLVRQRRLEADLTEEMDFHREMNQRDAEKRGLPSPDAAFAAQRGFGSGAWARNQARDVWIWPWLQDLTRDCRFAGRLLAKDRPFTLAAVTVLGLGLAVTNMQFVLVNAICVRGLPIHNVDRVMFVAARDSGSRQLPLSYREFDAVSLGTPALRNVAAFANAPLVIGDEGLAPDRAAGTYVSAGAFSILGEKPLIGRDFEAVDDQPNAPSVAILSYSFWMVRYAGDPSIIGRSIRVNGTPSVVIGVMAEGFKFPSNTEVWRPLSAMSGLTTDRRAARLLSVIGRLHDTAAISDLGGQLGRIGGEFAREYPNTNQSTQLTARPINDQYNGRLTDPVWLSFIGVAIIVLLIASANAANLLLMRSVQRGHEVAVRASLGASRSQLVRQLLVEAALLAAISGVVGTGLSFVTIQIFSKIIPANTLPYWVTFTLDRRLFAVLCAICLGTVFVFGLTPALHLSKTDTTQFIKDGGRTTSGSARARRWTTLFLTAEFALTMVLLTALVYGVRVARAAERVSTTIDPANLTTTWLTLSGISYASPNRRAQFYEQLEQRIVAMPHITAAAFATNLPLSGSSLRHLEIDEHESRTKPTVWTITISNRYFDVLRLPLLRGRPFGERDGLAGYETAIVNQRFAEMFFPNADAIARRIRLTEPNAPNVPMPWLTVVAVSPNVRQRASGAEPDPVVYLPLASVPPQSAVLMVRTPADTATVGPLLREAVRGLDRDLPLYRTMTMEQALAEAQWNGRMSDWILNWISFVAVFLAAIGVYAVTAHAVAQRTHEIGIRMALGADRRNVLQMVVRRAAVQLGLGAVAGIGCTLAFDRLIVSADGGQLGAQLGHTMSDPLNLFAVFVLLAVLTALACVVPARRATQVDPAVALRYQ